MVKQFLLLLAMILAIPGTLFSQASSPILGRWQAEKNGVPWLALDVREKDSTLDGTIVFHVLQGSGSASPKVLGLQEVPLAKGKLAGNVFSFKVKNQQSKKTLDPSSGEWLSFEMILNDESHAKLKSDNGSEVPLVKKE